MCKVQKLAIFFSLSLCLSACTKDDNMQESVKTIIISESTVTSATANSADEKETDKRSIDIYDTTARSIINQIFQCTYQDAKQFESFFKDSSLNQEKEPAIILSEGKLEDYFQERLGSYMTQDCLEQLMSDRICSIPIMLSLQYSTNIEVKDVELTRRNSSEIIYDFTACLETENDNSIVSEVAGSMILINDTEEKVLLSNFQITKK